MDTVTFDEGLKLASTLAQLAAASGLGVAVARYLTAKGIDVHAIQNSAVVQAAGRSAKALLSDVVLKGDRISDPAVIRDVTTAVRDSLANSHRETLDALGATAGDVERIADNAVKGAHVDIVTAAVEPAKCAVPADPFAAAVATILAARLALAKLDNHAGP